MKLKAKYKRSHDFVGQVGATRLVSSGRNKREAEGRLRRLFSQVSSSKQANLLPSLDRIDVFLVGSNTPLDRRTTETKVQDLLPDDGTIPVTPKKRRVAKLKLQRNWGR